MKSEAPERYALGIDIGGTSIRAGVVGCDGAVAGRFYDAPHQGRDIGAQLARACAQLRREAVDRGISYAVAGIALAGGWDARTGVVTSAPTAPGLIGCDPRGFDVGAPVTALANDADAALHAEWRHGAARGSRTCLGFFVGTGVGGSAVVDGAPLRGSTGAAGEFGHLVVEPEGLACGCGGSGCLEQYASGPAVVREYGSRNAEPEPDAQTRQQGSATSARGIAVSARGGDAAAAAAFAAVGSRLGRAVASLTNVFNPDTVVIGGGLVDAADLFLPALKTAAARHMMPAAAAAATLTVAALGRAAGVIGAAALAGGRR
jgi:glucokinase